MLIVKLFDKASAARTVRLSRKNKDAPTRSTNHDELFYLPLPPSTSNDNNAHGEPTSTESLQKIPYS